MDINVVIGKLSMLLLIMILGYIAKKKNIISEENNKGLSRLIVNVTLPCLIMSSMLSGKAKVSTSSIISIVVIGAIVYTSLTLLAAIIPRLFKATKLEDGVYRFCTILNNNIFMGFPIIQSMLGDEALFYAAILNIPSTLFLFTFCVYYMTRYNGGGKFSPKQLLNLGIINSLICTALYFMGFTLPNVLAETTKSVGDMTVPLSMIVLGASLATMSAKEVFKDVKIYLFSIIKMVIIPIIGFFILSFFGVEQTILYVVVVSLAMPGPTLCVSMAIDYGADVKLASKYVFMSTMLSLITIPIVIKLVLLLLN